MHIDTASGCPYSSRSFDGQVVHVTLPASSIGDFPDARHNRLLLVEATRQFAVATELLTVDTGGAVHTSSSVTFALPLHCTYGTEPRRRL